LSSLMWILIPVYIAIMLVVLSQIASVESFLQWAFWTGIALFCGIGFIHAYCTFNIRNRTCTKCGAYGLWRQIHLVDTKVVPALLTRSLSGNPYPGPSMSDQSVQVESIWAKCSFEPIPGP
jgi:hypothetical protein